MQYARLSAVPTSGKVLGIDVGYSAVRKTTCFCVLEWTQTTASFTYQLATSEAGNRRQALAELKLSDEILGVAVDGPLTRDFRLVSHYRAAEAILSRGVLQKRGKPGPTSSPVGQQLHKHATKLAQLALNSTTIRPATHWDPIHEKCVVEALPNMFLAALTYELDVPVLARDASDRYWEAVVDRSDRLLELVRHLLPGREPTVPLKQVRNHEHRAAVVCALTALSVVADNYVSVGDPQDGIIILPPQTMWGFGAAGSSTWLEPVLRHNLYKVTRGPRARENHRSARIVSGSACWSESLGEPETRVHPMAGTTRVN